jgi:sialate O-acetylesterase
MTRLQSTLSFLSAGVFLFGTVHAQNAPQKMPREDVVEVPAIADGLCVSNLFQSHMVIQRDKPITVWGWAAPGEKVTVAFGGHSAEATAAADRSWQLELPAMIANGTPQVMTVQGKDQSLKLDDILIGDVWVLGGQSNMEFPISNVVDGPLEIVSANFPKIRLLTPPCGKGFDSVRSFERLHEWSDWSSRHFRKGDWLVCTPETVKDFSAIGYVFGRRLHMATGVPIGLVDTSLGGTTVETWTPEAVVKSIREPETQDLLKTWQEKIDSWDAQADLQKQVERYEQKKKQLVDQGKPVPSNLKRPSDLRPGPIADKNRPGYCYASVIRPLEGFAVKGAVFHQGYNNCFNGSAGARMYYQVFGKMIASWRKAFDDEQMPFCIISLCTAGEPQTKEYFAQPMNDIGAMIREAQYQTFRDLYDGGDLNIGFVSSFNFRKKSYHPQIKIPVGERAAMWAFVSQYELIKGDENWLPPTIKEVNKVDGTIQLTMSADIATKDDSDGELLGFAIAGEDRRFYPAEIQYLQAGKDNRNRPQFKRNILVLSSPFVSSPAHFRHAWARNPMTNLVNARGVPIATQRSDQWLPEETPVKFPLPPGATMETDARRLRGKIMKELELQDRERSVREAEAKVAEMKEKFLADKKVWEESKAQEAEKIRAAHELAQ